MGGAYAIDSTNCLDNCVETGGMLSPVDPGEMSDVIECGLEEIAIIPPSTKDSDSSVEVFRYSFISSPEPKAQGELIVLDWSQRPCVRPSVHTFKHEYL